MKSNRTSCEKSRPSGAARAVVPKSKHLVGRDASTGSGARDLHNERRGQHTEDHNQATAPPLAERVSSMAGQPLDTRTRRFMESGFGRSFCDVRVHTDSAAAGLAAAHGAEAFATGGNLVFAAGRYRPDTARGAMVLAHELAHVVQQQGAKPREGGETVGMEDAADAAAVRVMQMRRAHVAPAANAPAVQFLKVTSGALGKALEVYTKQWSVPDRAIELLRASPTFMQLAAAIDRVYVWRGDSYQDDPSPDYGPDGRISKGKFKGKRELFDVINGPAEFEPMGAPPEPGRTKLSGDVIQLEGVDTPKFIDELAHEVTHVANSIGVSAPPPATLAASIDASINDEVSARTSEKKVLGEVAKTPMPAQLKGQIKDQIKTVGSTVPAQVERDLSPAFGMTYRENAFFGFRLNELQTAEHLTDEEAEKIRADVEKAVTAKQTSVFIMQPNIGPNGLINISKYADVWFDRRTVQLEWKALFDKHAPNDPPQAEQEALLQDHARRFFGGQAAYTALPVAAPPASTGAKPGSKVTP